MKRGPKAKKKTILGARDANGHLIDLKSFDKNRNIMALHQHPDQIRKNISELIEMAEDKDIKNLFVDIQVLVEWALKRLPLVKPTGSALVGTKERGAQEEPTLNKSHEG